MARVEIKVVGVPGYSKVCTVFVKDRGPGGFCYYQGVAHTTKGLRRILTRAASLRRHIAVNF
jgi:hypothetical protein